LRAETGGNPRASPFVVDHVGSICDARRVTGAEVVQFVAGLAGLLAGAEILVRGASQLALRLGLSPLVVGLTVVAFGTSSPELAVSVVAAFDGRAGVAVGNVIGSNLCNMLLILGLTAVIAPLIVDRWLVIRDGPLMMGLAVLTVVFMADGALGRIEGGFLFAVLVAYLALAILQARAAAPRRAAPEEDLRPNAVGLGKDGLRVGIGLGLLTWGSDWLVESASAGARALGVSELVVGLTIVSIGTSLPEIATSLMAAARGERDLAAGNVVGSNIFNMGCVLGIAGLVSPQPIHVSEPSLTFDLPWMLATGALVLGFLAHARRVSRLEGATLAALYTLYLVALVADAQGWARLDASTVRWFAAGLAVAAPALFLAARRRR